ncbi:MAG: hypothetical protein ACU0A2_11485 [Cognatishimia sp.]|uniref:hypothetical protein n=1 Tax=Cognatishimia sp. TaxID=2211648 RepID=UPI004057E309
MPRQNFEKFYYSKVALGEGCGCAERVIDNHEIERIRSGLGRSSGRPGITHRLLRLVFNRRPKAEPAKD